MSGSVPADPQRWKRIEEILDEAIELPSGERAALVEALCAGDLALAGEVKALLQADAAAEGFLRVRAADQVSELLENTVSEHAPTEWVELGPYRLKRLIGQGGMGRVFEALDPRLGRTVAVKVLASALVASRLAKDRFLREARAASALDHPNLVTVHDLGETPGGELYLVTALYEGETLRERLSRGPLDFDTARAVALGVARGLAAAHRAGILHRDVKPANIFLTTAGETKLLDFGIARIVGESGPTKTGQVPGTPAYMAPEQVLGDPLDERVDLWGLGATLYEMLSGRRAFPGDGDQAVINSVLQRDPDPLSRWRPDAPPELSNLVARLLAKHPADRPTSAEAVIAGLAATDLGSTLLEGGFSRGTAKRLATDIAARPTPLLRVLVATDLEGLPDLTESRSEERAFAFSSRHDRALRDLVARFGGQEVEKGSGFLLLFERAVDALGFALTYQQVVLRLGPPEGLDLAARVGVHLGEVLLRKNPEADVSRGAKPLEIEGQAKVVVSRILTLALRRQTLLTRAVFDLARRATLSGELGDAELSWLAHGTYSLSDLEEALDLFEVGMKGFAPLSEPPSSASARRVVALEDELALGWRPAAGQPVPRRPNWALAERLGEGGFGEVWLARHRSGEVRVFKFCFEPERLRALKREVTLFHLLRDALGHRDDIARILDWSFEQPPYFLEAEYTEGGNLVEWAAAEGGLDAIPLPLRLELAAEVAGALGAAHSVGVLHKDVKPENVLVGAGRDGTPHALLTDFGVGRIDPGAVAALPGLTSLGFTATASAAEGSEGGSVRYMAPELLEGKPATIQADLYSLGVLTYQLVVGDFSRALAPGWQRDIDDDLLAEDLAYFVDGRPERRPASAVEVAERLRTLESRRQARDQERRDAEEAAAIRAALDRQMRRRKVATRVAAASLAVLVLVGTLAVRERQARKTAALRQQQAEGLIGYMLGDLRDKLEPVGRLEILDGVGAKALEYFAAVPVGELSDEELARRSQALYQLGDVRVRQGKLPEAIAPLEESLALAQELVTRDPENLKRVFNLAQSHFWLGSAQLDAGHLKEARAQFLSYFDLASRSVKRDPKDRTWQMELAYAQTNLAAVAEAEGNLAEAVTRAEASLAIKERLATGRPGDLGLVRDIAGGHSWLARARAKQGDLKGALHAYEEELALRRSVSAKDSGNTQDRAFLAIALSHVAEQLWPLGRTEEARGRLLEMREILVALTALDPDNDRWLRFLAVCHRELGELAAARGMSEEARSELAEASRLLAKLGAATSAVFDLRREAAQVELALADLAFVSKKPAAAQAAATESLAAIEDLTGERPRDPRLLNLQARALLLLGRLAAARGDHAAAERAWRQALVGVAPGASADPLLLAPWTEALFALNRGTEAEPVRNRLRASGFAIPFLFE